MRSLIFAALCLAAGMAWADTTGEVVKVHTLTVKERIQNLELINVTVEKPASEQAEAIDAELQLILEETEQLEKVETSQD